MTDQHFAYGCVAMAVVAGGVVLMLQAKTLRDVCAKNNDWPAVEAVCRSTAQFVKALAKTESLQAFARANDQVERHSHVRVLLFDDKLRIVSDGMLAHLSDDDKTAHDERLRSISQALQSASKHDVPRRVAVALSDRRGAVRQVEMCTRWVSNAEMWVCAFKWT
tara:strand:+ start:667 stop:1158 length:492 start_codon:yes stop_codon:yes gene_type:complete